MSIAVESSSYRYASDEAWAVHGVSLTIEPGEVIGIVGPNGSGKSTLGRLMKGLYVPASGSVQVNGVDTAVDALEVRKAVGLVFQNPNSQIVNGVVENEVAFGPENLALPPPEVRSRVSQALRDVSLSGMESSETHGLSMADKQRVALAAVLAMEPRYLILDESTAWLEPASRWRILDRVVEWGKRRNAGIALITHRMDEAMLCGRLYGMLHGQVAAQGTPSDVLGDPDVVRRLSLSTPEGLVLAEDLRSAGLPVPETSSMERIAEALCPS